MGLISLKDRLLKCHANTLRELGDFPVFLEPARSENILQKHEPRVSRTSVLG